MSADKSKFIEIEAEITSYLGGLETNSIVFDYKEKDGHFVFDLLTVSPRHKQSFLFHSVEALTKEDCLYKMLAYLREYRVKESSYTIQWSLMGEEELHTSYFRANNILSALDKFYHARDLNSIVVFSVVLNPIA
ncbi:MAG: hypothetical protein JKY54_00880 [Flavobacteriales bacterium]|nr:hypothetical protein [Flavobacteriales bacterium]